MTELPSPAGVLAHKIYSHQHQSVLYHPCRFYITPIAETHFSISQGVKVSASQNSAEVQTARELRGLIVEVTRYSNEPNALWYGESTAGFDSCCTSVAMTFTVRTEIIVPPLMQRRWRHYGISLKCCRGGHCGLKSTKSFTPTNTEARPKSWKWIDPGCFVGRDQRCFGRQPLWPDHQHVQPPEAG